MAKAKQGDKVKVHYTGTLDDGTVFDSSINRDPLEFTVGGGQVIAGFDAAVIDLEPGEFRNVHIIAADAYGPHHPENMFTVNKEQFPPEITPVEGQKLNIPHPHVGFVPVKVVKVTDTEVTLDANHELAGKDLNFAIQLVEIVQ